MATYFVDSGRADDTGNGLTWAAAKKTIQAALTAASSGADLVIIKYNVDHTLGADTSFSTTNSVSIIAGSADDTSTAWTPQVMGTANFIGNSSTNYYIRLDGGADDKVYWYGCTFRVAATTADDLRVNASASGCDMVFESCYFWQGNANGIIIFGLGGVSSSALYGCTLRLGATSASLQINATVQFHDCTISSDGSTPTSLITTNNGAGLNVLFSGCDLSLVTGTLVTNMNTDMTFIFERCKFGSGVTVLATQTSNPTPASANAYVFDCNSGDTHLFFGYYDAMGSVINDTGIYFTSTDAEYVNSSNTEAPVSWKIVTSANASFWSPFRTPWINLYHTGTSAITPYFEILRDGSTTAYQDDEIWAQFSAKATSGSTKSTFYSDRKDIDTGTAAANQTAGAGTGSWTGEAGSAWSGKIDSGSAITPAEKGYIRGRFCVGEPSITVYVDPQIRT